MNLEELRRRYADAVTRMRAAAAAAEAAPDDEALHGAFVEARTACEQAQAAVERGEAIERARQAHPEPEPAPDPEPDARVPEPATSDARVTREELVYAPGDRRASFFGDLIAAKGGDSAARERLTRNNAQVVDAMAERVKRSSDVVERSRQAASLDALRERLGMETRAISQTAGAGGEFVPPTWLNDQYAPLLRAGRAFADQCISQPIAMGTNQINVPKVTTGASTAVQSDGGAVSNTDLATTSVTAQYQTIAGRTVASYQLFDLGVPSMDGVIYQDLLADYWRSLDSALINGNVTNAKGFLNLTGINAITFTNATPTGPLLYPPMFQGVSAIQKGAFVGVDFTLWHPSTWNWYLSQLDGNSRPLALSVEGAAFNAMGQFNRNAQGLAGNFAGFPVVVDANVPVNLGAGTNEARIGLFNRQTLYLYEDTPRFKIADQTNIANLQYQFVLYGYYAVAFGRQPKMISVLSGTGLVVQSGF
jgi:HK97 family phage major capsid protein